VEDDSRVWSGLSSARIRAIRWLAMMAQLTTKNVKKLMPAQIRDRIAVA